MNKTYFSEISLTFNMPKSWNHSKTTITEKKEDLKNAIPIIHEKAINWVFSIIDYIDHINPKAKTGMHPSPLKKKKKKILLKEKKPRYQNPSKGKNSNPPGPSGHPPPRQSTLQPSPPPSARRCRHSSTRSSNRRRWFWSNWAATHFPYHRPSPSSSSKTLPSAFSRLSPQPPPPPPTHFNLPLPPIGYTIRLGPLPRQIRTHPNAKRPKKGRGGRDFDFLVLFFLQYLRYDFIAFCGRLGILFPLFLHRRVWKPNSCLISAVVVFRISSFPWILKSFRRNEEREINKSKGEASFLCIYSSRLDYCGWCVYLKLCLAFLGIYFGRFGSMDKAQFSWWKDVVGN